MGVFVGRSEELARATLAVDRALSGDGALLLLAGEAGIGKTRLADGVASIAGARGARVVWGRAWEAGGAPAYWPWIQVFRALGIDDDPFTAMEASSVDVQQARFQRFDRAVAGIKRAASASPLVIVLDDLHAADVPSLLLLQLLVRDLRAARLLVVGTYRDVEARLGSAGAILAKVAREGEAVKLRPLMREDVVAWMSAALPAADAAAREDEVERVFRVTEGNPLFVHELLRVREGKPGAIAQGASLPDGLRAVLDDSLAQVDAFTRTILEAGSVLGREIDPAATVELAERSADEVDRALRGGVAAGLLTPIAGGERFAFTHILVREQLYGALVPSRRAALHGRAGERLVTSGGDLATAAHHLFEARGAVPAARAASVGLDAAQATFATLAFEDAARLCERGLEVHHADDALTCDLELLLGEARMRSGEIAQGKEVCIRAAERAKRLGAARHMARAALVHATELASGTVDPKMVALLRDALAVLDPKDDPVRARVLTRLAAALVPPLDYNDVAEIGALGREGIAMARRFDDPDTLLFALHYGGAAAGYLIPAVERYHAVCEIMALAELHRRPLITLNLGATWISLLRQFGRVEEAARGLERFERLVGEFPQPHYRWRLSMVRANSAFLAGDYDEAARLNAEGCAIAEQGQVFAGLICWAMNCVSFAQLGGGAAALAVDGERALAVLSRMSQPNGFATWMLAALGRHEEARALLVELTKNVYHFPWALLGGEVAVLLGDTAYAATFYEPLCAHAKRNALFWGPFGGTVFGSTQRVAADVAALLGRVDEARALYEEAIALGESMKAVPFVARAKKGLAALGAPSGAGAVIVPRSSTPTHIEVVREGEMWRVTSSTGTSMHLKDSKGLSYLADLLARPGGELHVTQLAELVETPGDAGSVLDERAKGAYRQRLEELRDTLEEATRFGDGGRAERAQSEIDAIAEQLASAVGLGGRDRKVGSHVERARINVQRRIRDAIQRIEEHDPALGRYLAATVKTGVFCSFTPV